MPQPPVLTENTFNHSNDKTTFYWSAGPLDGPLVIFIHGWPANGETWKPQLLALAALGFRAVAPDTRGYGRSSVPSDPSAYALEHHVSDMLALLSHLDRPRAVWIGHDWGAGLVWSLAAQRPEVCAGVCCMAVPYQSVELGIDWLVAHSNREIYPVDEYKFAQWNYQVFHNENPEASSSQLHANVARTVKALHRPNGPERVGKPAFTAKVLEAGGWFGGLPEAPDVPLEGSLFEHDKPAYERMVAEFEKNGFEGPNSYYRNQAENRTYTENAPNGGRLTFPVLFIEARWDTVCDTALSRLGEPMRELCGDLVEVSIDSGHWVPQQKPAEVNAAIVKWIATKLPTYYPGYWKSPFVSKK